MSSFHGAMTRCGLRDIVGVLLVVDSGAVMGPVIENCELCLLTGTFKAAAALEAV